MALGSAFMEGGGGGRKGEFGVLAEGLEDLVDFGEGGFFGFVGNREAGEIGVRGEFLFAAFGEEILSEGGEVGFQSGLDDGVVGLVGLNDNFGVVEMPATDTADDLGKEFKSTFFGSKIGEGESGVSLDDANSGEVGEIEAAGEGLSTDKDVDFAGFDVIIELAEAVFLSIVAVEASDLGFREEASELGFKEFGAKTFVDDAGMTATWAASGDFFLVTANMAGEEKAVGMERHGEVAGGAESLPATFLTDSKGGRAAAIMKNQSLMFSLDIFFDSSQDLVGKIAIFEEISAVFEVDDGGFRGDSGGFGFGGEVDEGIVGFGEVEINDIRGGGTLDTGDFEGAGHKTGETEGRITGGVFLVVGTLVGFVDDN